MLWLIKISISLLSFYVLFRFYCLYREETKQVIIERSHKLKLLFVGFVASVSDTLGMGSFALIIAFNKSFSLIEDKKLPGSLNVHAILPSLIQSIVFLQFIKIDLLTLVSLLIGVSIGGFAGGFFVARMNKQVLRLFMFAAYVGVAFLLFFNQIDLLPVGGEAISLRGYKLALAFVGMIITGSLPAIGVGLYATTQVLLFLLGMSPLVAFPLMTTAGALQQPITALAFILKKELLTRETLILTLAGVAGVLIAAPFVPYIDLSKLRWLLLAVVIFNAKMIWGSYRKDRDEGNKV